MLTTKMSGWFDCRKYKAGQERSQRALLSDLDVVTFNATFAKGDLPECFKTEANREYVHEYASKEAPEGTTDRCSVSFKISKSCKWFDKYGQPCTRPTNTDIDSVLVDGRFDAQIDFATVQPAPDAGPLAAKGFWANAIMYQKAETNPFEGQAFAAVGTESKEPTWVEGMKAEAKRNEEMKAAQEQAAQQLTNSNDNDLPF